jgi:DNA primase
VKADVPRLLAALGIAADREKKGRRNEIWAQCPYPDHDDRKASWSIRNEPANDRHGRHHCFSCHRGGLPGDLVMAVFGCTLDDAFEWMRASGLLLDDFVATETEVVERPWIGTGAQHSFKLPGGLIEKPFDEWLPRARDYALGRGLTPEQIERWSVSYGAYGRLTGRLVFPVYARDGALQSYQARSFLGREPKYLTPKREENPVEWAIFGAQYWPEEGGTVVLAEGVLKVLACERAGAQFIGALCGSQVAPEHLLELQRFDEFVYVKDSGSAGDSAAQQIVASLKRWKSLRVVELPSGEDADSIPLDELYARLW